VTFSPVRVSLEARIEDYVGYLVGLVTLMELEEPWMTLRPMIFGVLRDLTTILLSPNVEAGITDYVAELREGLRGRLLAEDPYQFTEIPSWQLVFKHQQSIAEDLDKIVRETLS